MYCSETAEQHQQPSETSTLLRPSRTDQNTLAAGEAAWILIKLKILCQEQEKMKRQEGNVENILGQKMMHKMAII